MAKSKKKKQIQKAVKGDLVQIHKVILTPEQRPEGLPESTKVVPYEGWIKGFLLENEANIGETVRIETFIGRELSGTLVEVNPAYSHNFGKPRLELLTIMKELERYSGGR
jgi:hypothetical protein